MPDPARPAPAPPLPASPEPLGDGASGAAPRFALPTPPESGGWDGGPRLVAEAEALADRLQALAPESDAHGALPEAELGALREGGWLAATLPERVGGAGLGTAPGSLHALLLVLRAVGRGSLPAGRLYEGHVNALRLVELYGTDDQLARAAHDARAGRLFGVWSAEGRDGVRVEPAPGGGVRLSGTKVFCSGVGAVSRPIVGGALPDGAWQMTLVPMDEAAAAPDPDAWQAEGMRASASGHVGFAGVRLGAERVLGRPGDYQREPHFLAGGIRFTAVHLGGAQALYDHAVAHLTRHDRLGHPVLQMRLGAMAAALETGALWLLGAARLIDRPAPDPEACAAYVQLARGAIERACLDVLEAADRTVGARGLAAPGPSERVGRDLRLYLRQPDPDGAQAAAGHYAALHPDRPRGSSLA